MFEPLSEAPFEPFDEESVLDVEPLPPEDLFAAAVDRVEPDFVFELDFRDPLVLFVLVRPPLAALDAPRLALVFLAELVPLSDDALPDAAFDAEDLERDDFEALDLVLPLARVLEAPLDVLFCVLLAADDLFAADELALLAAVVLLELVRFLAVERPDEGLGVSWPAVEPLLLDGAGASGTASAASRAAERRPDSAWSAARSAVSLALWA